MERTAPLSPPLLALALTGRAGQELTAFALARLDEPSLERLIAEMDAQRERGPEQGEHARLYMPNGGVSFHSWPKPTYEEFGQILSLAREQTAFWRVDPVMPIPGERIPAAIHAIVSPRGVRWRCGSRPPYWTFEIRARDLYWAMLAVCQEGSADRYFGRVSQEDPHLAAHILRAGIAATDDDGSPTRYIASLLARESITPLISHADRSVREAALLALPVARSGACAEAPEPEQRTGSGMVDPKAPHPRTRTRG